MEPTRLLAFAGSYFFIALSPGLCMTLSMSLGITLGVRRTLWMMLGELIGVGLVGTVAVLGVAALLMNAPTVFTVGRWLGAAYLIYMGIQAWRAAPLAPGGEETTRPGGPARSRVSLAAQGFVTAVSNPKAWAFFVALLPPFVDHERPLAPQLLALLAVMLLIEFLCLNIYAYGGRALSEQLYRRGKAHWLNRCAGVLMVGVGVWLALG